MLPAVTPLDAIASGRAERHELAVAERVLLDNDLRCVQERAAGSPVRAAAILRGATPGGAEGVPGLTPRCGAGLTAPLSGLERLWSVRDRRRVLGSLCESRRGPRPKAALDVRGSPRPFLLIDMWRLLELLWVEMVKRYFPTGLRSVGALQPHSPGQRAWDVLAPVCLPWR